MTAAKHTPGPWFEHSHRQIGPQVGVVCEVWSAIGKDSGDAISQADANCALIATAPELLEFAQAFSAFVHAEDCATDGPVIYSAGHIRALAFAARAAIAKATGEAA